MIVEIVLLIISCVFTFRFLKKWYQTIFLKWPPIESKAVKYTLNVLPLISLVIYLITLNLFASFDVVDNIFYIAFYTLLGFVWLNFGMFAMALFLDISWVDDVVNMNNKAALLSIAGGFTGLALIYAGANIGDGPGWWCVIFAGGLGLAAWVIIAIIVNLFTNIFERITVDRDIKCGIRIGFFFLASGIILARASAGDWTSSSMTVVEFAAGWPVLPLSLLAILVEYYFIYKSKQPYNRNYDNGSSDNIAVSVFSGVVYTAIAIISVILIPLN